MPERLEHSGNAPETTLTATLSAGVLSFTVDDETGYPTGAVGPFVVILGAGTSSMEKVLCTSRSGAAFTIEPTGRGWDGTSDTTHPSGTTVTHGFSATEADEANAHIMAESGVHGVTGDVVGTTDTQTLSGKTFTTPTIPSFVNAQHDHGDSDSGGTIPQASVTGLTTDLATIVASVSAESTARANADTTEANARTAADNALDARLDTLEALLSDTGELTSTTGFTASSGWTLVSVAHRKWGPVVTLHITAQRTGATITGASAGNVTDTDILDAIPTSLRPTLTGFRGLIDKGSVSFGSFVIETGGSVQIETLHATADITSGDNITISATYLKV